MAALKATDDRLREDKPVSPAFLLAALLWGRVERRWKELEEKGQPSTPSLHSAMHDALDPQRESLAIPRRFDATMKELWLLQPRFLQRGGTRPFRLLEHPRFRAAYDFFELRARAGNAPLEIAQWWERFQDASGEERERMLHADEGPKRKKRAPPRRPAPRGRRRLARGSGAGRGRMKPVRAVVALGSNLDRPEARVRRAFDEVGRLPSTRLLARSALYRTAPVGFVDQRAFINACALVETPLGPRELLQALLAVERAHGRVRDVPNGPRTLDLDIVLYGDLLLHEHGLTLPHPRGQVDNALNLFKDYNIAETIRRAASPSNVNRLLKKAHLRRCRTPAALRRTDTVRLAPRRVPIEDE